MAIAFDFPSVPVPTVGDDVELRPYSGPEAWYGPDLAGKPEEWTYELSGEQIEDLRAAIAGAEKAGISVVELRAKDFPLPSWSTLLDTMRKNMFEGRGFALLRGMPVAEMSPLQRALGYFGIGSHYGVATPQNAKGHAVGHICDIGVDYASTTGRGYQTSDRLPFHSDSSDIVALLCVNQAKSGGLSSLVSSATLYNEMLKKRPDLVRQLMGPIYRDRREEVPEGQGPWYVIPAFNPYQGRLFTTYVRSTVRKAQRFSEIPRISPALEEAMDMLDAMADDPAYHLKMDFQPGDIQFVCNHFLLHSRTHFEDYEDPAKRRHLLRLQLACADGPALPPVYENLRGFNEDGRPAGMARSDVPLIAPLEPIDGGPGAFDQRALKSQDARA